MVVVVVVVVVSFAILLFVWKGKIFVGFERVGVMAGSGGRGLLSLAQGLMMGRSNNGGNLLGLAGRRTCFRASSSSSVWWEESSDVADDGGSSSGSRVVEQVLHEFRIQKAAPDWLPFLPGGSFWVPPAEEEEEDRKSYIPSFDNATEGEVLALMMPMGWPGPDTVPEGKNLLAAVLQSLLVCISTTFVHNLKGSQHDCSRHDITMLGFLQSS